VALAISSVFLVGAYAAFVQISVAQHASEARAEALRNGRTALATMSSELKSIISLQGELIGVDDAAPYGDGIDNNANGKVDEKRLNGQPDSAGAATTGAVPRELTSWTKRPDPGDPGVDQDCLFGRDQVMFDIFPSIPTPGMTAKWVRYVIANYDGQPNVLLRETMIEIGGATPNPGVQPVNATPIAFGVLGFDVLYWNPNVPAAQRGWVATWDTRTVPAAQLGLPASVFIRLTLYADPRPYETWTPGRPVETIKLETMVNIEPSL